ncbi:hypothetical protein TNCV_2352151 [Trichonephila clavipes]|nr:hypothetical protein TNCV_2352151 [Trichonephila clavipes]
MTGKGIQGVIYPWKRVAVLLGDVVKPSIVHAKSCGAIFLTNQDDWRCPRTRRRFYDVIFPASLVVVFRPLPV